MGGKPWRSRHTTRPTGHHRLQYGRHGRLRARAKHPCRCAPAPSLRDRLYRRRTAGSRPAGPGGRHGPLPVKPAGLDALRALLQQARPGSLLPAPPARARPPARLPAPPRPAARRDTAKRHSRRPCPACGAARGRDLHGRPRGSRLPAPAAVDQPPVPRRDRASHGCRRPVEGRVGCTQAQGGAAVIGFEPVLLACAEFEQAVSHRVPQETPERTLQPLRVACAHMDRLLAALIRYAESGRAGRTGPADGEGAAGRPAVSRTG